MTTRRVFVRTWGDAPRRSRAAAPVACAESAYHGEEIAMRSDTAGSTVWFDPIGVLVAPGATIRWVVKENVHTTTAYHPGTTIIRCAFPKGPNRGTLDTS